MGENEFKFSPKRAPPRKQNLGGKRGHSWKEQGVGVMAGQVLRVQVASRPGVKRVNQNCWPATPKRWPPMCAQHKYVVKTQKM